MNTDDEICVLCCREIPIYAIGSCDHPVCYECSTRMRVLCEQNECPICRSEMPYVQFTYKKQLFSSMMKFPLVNKKYTISFENGDIEKSFQTLLEPRCTFCEEICGNFEELRKHASRSHNLFYCELCVDNLKIFPFERKQYTRAELGYHKRKGDPDNTSHRGHPLCEFCDKRFVDNDELYRHLRKEHFFCHFCDADGTLNEQFYNDYSFLKVHFRKVHYLCEEGECASQEFVRAFRTEIDFKAHKALMHRKNKTKAEVMQARTLDLEFPITPRNAANGNWSPNHNEPRKGRYGAQNNHTRKQNTDDRMARESFDDNRNGRESEKAAFNTQCVQDFPSLVNGLASGASNHFVESNRYSSCIEGNNFTKPSRRQTSKAGFSEDFPALSMSNVQHNAKVSEQGKRHIQTNDRYPKSRNSDCKLTKVWNKPQNNQAHTDSKMKNQMPPTGGSNLDKEFPKLKTRDVYAPSVQSFGMGEWCKTKGSQKEREESLEEQMFQKCKSRKKKKNTSSKPDQRTQQQTDRDEAPQLSKMYSGLSNRSAIENEENEVPLEKVDLRLYNKMDRYRMQDKEDDDVPWRETVHLVEDDFPPLGNPNNDISQFPSGLSSAVSPKPAPPGFETKWKAPISNYKSFSLSSIAQQLNNNTMLQSEEKDDQYTNCTYCPPTDFQKRNSSLIEKIMHLTKSDDLLFEKFKLLSGNFRKDTLSAAKYYTNCMEILGKEKFMEVFTELLCLLPDIRKQQELLKVHNASIGQDSKKEGALPKHKTCKAFNASLITCEICLQVLMKYDYEMHIANH